MARARAEALRALLARCSTKCPTAAAALRLVLLSPAISSAASTASSSPRLRPAAAAAATRSLSSKAPDGIGADEPDGEEWEEEEDGEAEEWEEEDEVEPELGDGGDGGGVVLRDVKWGERALAAASEVLGEHFGDDIAMFAFRVSPKGYVYVRLDKLTHKYGCPDIKEIESFNELYKQKLDKIVDSGEIPLDLAIEVSSPGAERLLKVPEDFDRFKDMAMRVEYLEDNDLCSKQNQQKDGIFLLESIDAETERCVWKLADVKENRAEAGKGRPLRRKQKDWRLQTPFTAVRRVSLYLESNH